MKKHLKRALALILAVCIVSLMAAACNTKKDDNFAFEPPEFVYAAQSVPLPDDVGDIRSLSYIDGKVFFVSLNWDYNEETYEYSSSSAICSINPDGSGYTELPDYNPPVDVPDDASGGATIERMKLDNAGNFWVLERYDISRYNFPDDFDPENDEPWNYYEEIGNGTIMRKLSSGD